MGMNTLPSFELLRSVDPSLPLYDTNADLKHWAAGVRRRRSAVLSSARNLISQDGWESTTVRRIADLSEVSVQTLYNLFGNRSALLQAALCEDVPRMGRHALQLSVYDNPIAAMADMSCYYANRWPQYIDAALRFNSPLDPGYAKIQQCRVRCFVSLIESMRQSHAMRADANAQVLATNLTILMVATLMEWIGGVHPLGDLRGVMATRVSEALRPNHMDQAAIFG